LIKIPKRGTLHRTLVKPRGFTICQEGLLFKLREFIVAVIGSEI